MSEEFKISDWLQKAKEDPKEAGVPLVILLGIGFVVWKFLYSPKAALIDRELKKNKRLISEMKNFKDSASKIEDIKIDIEEMKNKWEEAQKLCYKELDRTQFLRRVRELANQSNISIKSINPAPDENIKVGNIKAKKFSVSFFYSGNLEPLLTFMRLIELEPQICFIPIPALAPTASGTFDMNLTVSTILLPDTIGIETIEEPADDGDY